MNGAAAADPERGVPGGEREDLGDPGVAWGAPDTWARPDPTPFPGRQVPPSPAGRLESPGARRGLGCTMPRPKPVPRRRGRSPSPPSPRPRARSE